MQAQMQTRVNQDGCCNRFAGSLNGPQLKQLMVTEIQFAYGKRVRDISSV